MSAAAVGEVVEVSFGHGAMKATVSGVFDVACTHGSGCRVLEAISERGNPIVWYMHEVTQ